MGMAVKGNNATAFSRLTKLIKKLYFVKTKHRFSPQHPSFFKALTKNFFIERKRGAKYTDVLRDFTRKQMEGVSFSQANIQR